MNDSRGGAFSENKSKWTVAGKRDDTGEQRTPAKERRERVIDF